MLGANEGRDGGWQAWPAREPSCRTQASGGGGGPAAALQPPDGPEQVRRASLTRRRVTPSRPERLNPGVKGQETKSFLSGYNLSG
jgi:hypothetical protein